MTHDNCTSSDLDGIGLDPDTLHRVDEKLKDLEELLPGWAIALMPPPANAVIEKLAANRGVTGAFYISQAVGYVTGLQEKTGIWIGDLVQRAVAKAVLDEMDNRAQAGRLRKGH